MLSLFRHATRRSVSAARPALVARYSTAPGPYPDPEPEPDTSGMEEIHQVLHDVAERQPKFGSSSSDFSLKETAKWKPFIYNRIVTPRDFTYDARINTPARRPYKEKLGPPPSIARYNDIFYQYDIDPVDMAMEPQILSRYVSEMGKVYGRNHTGLTSKSQRRLGKAIRRAKMMGMIPVLSRYKKPQTSK